MLGGSSWQGSQGSRQGSVGLASKRYADGPNPGNPARTCQGARQGPVPK